MILHHPLPKTVHPNFFIVGAARAGTTSLWKYLNEHPDVFMPGANLLVKEPGYFCDLPQVPWAPKFWSDFDAYLDLFSDGHGRSAVGEATVLYLVAPESPERIHRQYPNAKIIICLRNPVDRAYSLYRLMCSGGFEWLHPFERALQDEERRAHDEALKATDPRYYGYLYYRSGLYHAQVERYMKRFPREQIHFVLFDDLKKDPAGTFRNVCSFLGVDPGVTPTFETHNKSCVPLSLGVQHSLVRAGRWVMNSPGPLARVARTSIMTNLLRSSLLLAAQANLMLGTFSRSALDPQVREDLTRRYERDIRKTAGLIGRDLEHWITPKPARQRVPAERPAGELILSRS